MDIRPSPKTDVLVKSSMLSTNEALIPHGPPDGFAAAEVRRERFIELAVKRSVTGEVDTAEK